MKVLVDIKNDKILVITKDSILSWFDTATWEYLCNHLGVPVDTTENVGVLFNSKTVMTNLNIKENE